MSGTVKKPHEWLLEFTSFIHEVVLGRDAAELLTPTSESALVQLPSWIWVDARIDAGTKGKENLLPLRINWHGPQVRMVSGESVFDWTAIGLGYSRHGQTKVRVGSGSNEFGPLRDVPKQIAVPLLPFGELDFVVDSLITQSDKSWWEALSLLDSSAFRAANVAHGAVSSELGREALLDEVGLEALRDQLLINPGRNTGVSPAQRILTKCLVPETFNLVDPGLFVFSSLSRDAYTLLRSMIGDPHVGSRIRKLSRSLSITDPDELLVECQKRYPTWTISRTAVSRALETGSTVDATAISLDSAPVRFLSGESYE